MVAGKDTVKTRSEVVSCEIWLFYVIIEQCDIILSMYSCHMFLSFIMSILPELYLYLRKTVAVLTSIRFSHSP